jgi:hypothetical protein
MTEHNKIKHALLTNTELEWLGRSSKSEESKFSTWYLPQESA